MIIRSTKLNLLAATALSTALVLGNADAMAQAKAKKLSLSIGGFFTSLVGISTQNESFEKTADTDTSRTHYDAFNNVNNSEVHFVGSTKLENGLTVLVTIEIESDQSSAGTTVDDSFMTIDGAFGQIRLGSTQPGSHDIANTAPVVGALAHDNANTDDWIIKPSTASIGTPGSDISDGNAMKVVYVSPSLAGFRLGGSYEPSGTNNNTMPAVGGTAGTDSQTYDIGLAYSGKMGAANFSADVQVYRVQGTVANSSEAMRGGASISNGPWKIGGGYKEISDVDTGIKGTATSAEEETWDIGVSYTASGWALGLTALGSSKPLASSVQGEDTVLKLLLGGSYNLGPGIDLVGTAAFVRWEDELTTGSLNNDGFAVVGGVAVTF